MDPSDFYIGLWLSSICRSSPPAGKPNPTRALRRSGIGVDGAVSSVDMLRICRARAAIEDLEICVYRQRMETLDLARRFRSMVLAGPTFTLLPPDA